LSRAQRKQGQFGDLGLQGGDLLLQASQLQDGSRFVCLRRDSRSLWRTSSETDRDGLGSGGGFEQWATMELGQVL
jgi:hypothetical protein